MAGARLHARGADLRQVGRRHAQVGQPLGVREIEQAVGARPHRRPGAQDDGRAGAERDHHPVPHVPAGAGLVEEPVVAPQVVVEPVLLEQLDQHAAGAVHDALGQAGRSRRVEHERRRVERGALEDGVAGVAGTQRAEVDRPRWRTAGSGRLGNRDHVAQRRQPRDKLRRPGRGPDERRDRIDLAQPISHRIEPGVPVADRPDRADAACRQHRDHRLGPARQDGHDPVPGRDTQVAQSRSHARHLGSKLTKRERAPRPVCYSHDRGRLVAPRQHILGEGQPRVREEASIRHARPALDHSPAAVADDAEKVPQHRPERLGLPTRPGMERGVVAAHTVSPGRRAVKRGELRLTRVLGRWLPHRCAHRAQHTAGGGLECLAGGRVFAFGGSGSLLCTVLRTAHSMRPDPQQASGGC